MTAFVGLFAGRDIESAELVSTSHSARLIYFVAAALAEELRAERPDDPVAQKLIAAHTEALDRLTAEAEEHLATLALRAQDQRRLRRAVALIRRGLELVGAEPSLNGPRPGQEPAP